MGAGKCQACQAEEAFLVQGSAGGGILEPWLFDTIIHIDENAGELQYGCWQMLGMPG